MTRFDIVSMTNIIYFVVPQIVSTCNTDPHDVLLHDTLVVVVDAVVFVVPTQALGVGVLLNGLRALTTLVFLLVESLQQTNTEGILFNTCVIWMNNIELKYLTSNVPCSKYTD